jgi:hypothetical protein
MDSRTGGKKKVLQQLCIELGIPIKIMMEEIKLKMTD